ncbi:MAG: MbcA/ParS/Xre antitoxin family protein [Pseudomonadota bacterium]
MDVPEEPFLSQNDETAVQRRKQPDVVGDRGPGLEDEQAFFHPEQTDFDVNRMGVRALSDMERLRAVVRTGLPLSKLKQELSRIDLTIEDLEECELIPKGHFTQPDGHQAFAEAPFDRNIGPSQLKRIFRFVRIVRRAHTTIGKTETVMRWLSKPFEEYDGATGIQLLKSEEGGGLVLQRLDAIDHGMNA